MRMNYRLGCVPPQIRSKRRQKRNLSQSSRHSIMALSLSSKRSWRSSTWIATYIALLSPPEASMARALAFNRIMRSTAMNNVDSRYEWPSLVLESPQINLTGQRLGELLDRFGKSNILDWFVSQLIEETGMKDTLIYDITSLSNCSQPINFLNMRAIEMQNHFHKSILIQDKESLRCMISSQAVFPMSAYFLSL